MLLVGVVHEHLACVRGTGQGHVLAIELAQRGLTTHDHLCRWVRVGVGSAWVWVNLSVWST